LKELLTHLKKLNILYVEDDTSTREELEYFFSTKVNKLFVAKNGEEGFNLYKNEKPDIVVTDIQMPVLNGIDMIEKIRNIDNYVPIVVITAFSDTDYLFKAIKLNVNHYLTKPLNLISLVDILAKLSKNISLEKDNKEILNTLKQYKDIVDERSIISKSNLEGIITYVNEPFEKISGYTKDELIGKPHNIVAHPDTKISIVKELWKRIKIEKRLWQGRIKNLAKDGSEYYVDIIMKPILDLDGNIIEFISLSNDITDLEKSKEYFKEQHQKGEINLGESIRIANSYKEAIDESNIILRMNLDKKIVYANDAFFKISGYTNDELIGKDYSFLEHVGLTKNEAEKKNRDIFSGEIWKGKISNYKKNGDIFHCSVTMYPLKDKYGNVIEFMGIRHDITEIENLQNELVQTQREIIFKLGQIAETRSEETGNHVKRVAEYSKLLAQKINLNKEDINLLFLASPMHDIGKIGIPDSILNKPGKLDPNEWEVMKTHAQIGYEIFKDSSRPILKAASIVSYTHHEKWDGSGYPLGLKGDDIHIFGRVTAVADVFDALGSDRVYKKSWPLENILDFFKKESGKHFDPNLIKIFIDNLDEFLEIREKFKDN
jgi:PAS domain S-box-containing protein